MRRNDRGAEPGHDFIRTIEIKNKDGQVVERREVVSCKGLLHLAHNERLSKIRTRLLQSPSKENGDTTIVLVAVTTSRGTFTGLGDANPRNVTPKIAIHTPRMAETRALARALRAALDIGAVAIEELEEEFSFVDTDRERPRDERTNGRGDHQAANGVPAGSDRAPDRERRPNGHHPNGNGSPSPRTRGGGYDPNGGNAGPDAPMSEPQKKMLYRIAYERGHEGDASRAWLHSELEVDSLSKVTRRQASAFIDHYKSNGQQGGRREGQGTNGHAGAS